MIEFEWPGVLLGRGHLGVDVLSPLVSGDGTLHELLDFRVVGGDQHVRIGVEVGHQEVLAGLQIVLVDIFVLFGHVGFEPIDGDRVTILAALFERPVRHHEVKELFGGLELVTVELE